MAYDPIADIAAGWQAFPILEKGDRGWHVRLLQRALQEEHRVWCVIDGVFGEETRQAVHTFQMESGMVADGVVGPQTWHALGQYRDDETVGGVAPMTPDEFAKSFTYDDIRGRILVLAEALLAANIKEKGQNRGEMVDAFNRHAIGHVGEPWCASFCDFVVDNAYRKTGLEIPYDVGASSSGIYRKASAKGLVRKTPRPGDLFLVPGGPTGYQHTGIVSGIKGSKVETIEGNTNEAGSSEGQGLYRRERDASLLVFCSVTN